MHLLDILVISPQLDNVEISVGGTIAVSLRQNLHETNPIVLNTIGIALTCYAIVVGLLLSGCRGRRWRNLLRPMWTIVCIVIVTHVIAAFHYWSGLLTY